MTRAQRALAAAIAIVPLSVSGAFLLRCHCAFAAWALEVVTATAYVLWILRGG